jgi:hypothetical protein
MQEWCETAGIAGSPVATRPAAASRMELATVSWAIRREFVLEAEVEPEGGPSG